jgi:signal transduction histidine kinase
MKKLLLVYIVCYLFCGAKAQNEPFGSTKDFKYIKQNALKPHIKLDLNKIDTTLVLGLIEEGNRLRNFGFRDSAVTLFERALNYSKIIKYTYGEATSAMGLGKTTVPPRLNSVNAMAHTRRAIVIFKKLRHKTKLGTCYLNLSLFYINAEIADSALDYVYRALSIVEYKDLTNRGFASYCLGIIYGMVEQNDKAIENLRRAEFLLSRDVTIKNIEYIFYVYFELARYHTLTGSDSAIFYHNKVAKLSKLTKSYKHMADAYLCIGHYYAFQKNWSLSKSYVQDAIKLYAFIHNQTGLWNANQNLGVLCTKTGEYQKALIHLKNALYLATKISDLRKLNVSNESLYILFEKTKSYKEALVHYKNYVVLGDSLKDTDEESQRLKANLTVDFKNKELRLKEEALVKDLQNEIKINKQSKYYLVIVFTLCLTILLVTLLAIRKNLKQKILANKQIAAMQAEKYKLSLEIQESERRVIAREIHDSAGALISAIKYSLANCLVLSNQQILTEKLEANISHAGKLGDELRNISHRMMPIVLIEDGLGNAISYLLDSLLRLNDIKYEFENEVGTKRFEEQIEITLYRITEELLSNILKHSQSKNVAVILYQSKNNLVLTMEDDGIGFNPQVKKGLGLTSIDLRLTAVRGKISFENKVTAGVLTTINIPLITANTVS